MSPQFEIQVIAAIVAVACSLLGVFLVLRKMSMMSDSITHTILLGIVLAFFITGDLSSPLLIIGAAIIGVVTVWLTEMLNRTRLVSEDSAIGVIFPLLFSIAIILITRYAGSVHLDTDSVLLGELAFAPFDRMVLFGVDIGAKSIYISGVLLLLNILFIVLFFKELKVSTFDPMLAVVLGISPMLLHYGLMTMVSLTCVGAFGAVGSVLVVAFMVGPPITAYLLTDNLKIMLFLSAGIGIFASISGYQLAAAFDVSIAGSMAVMIGLLFFCVFLCSPKRGMISILIRRHQQKLDFSKKNVILYLYKHMGNAKEAAKLSISAVEHHFHLDKKYMNSIIARLIRENQIYITEDCIYLTKKGMAHSRDIWEEFSL